MSPTPNKRTWGLGLKGVDSDIGYDVFKKIFQSGENEIGDNWVEERVGFFSFSFSFFLSLFWEGVGSEAVHVREFTQEDGKPAAESI